MIALLKYSDVFNEFGKIRQLKLCRCFRIAAQYLRYQAVMFGYAIIVTLEEGASILLL